MSDSRASRRLRRFGLPLASSFVALAAAAGCGGGGDGPERFDLSGSVTYDGKPVPKGFVTFEPDASQGNSGPGGGAPIEEGRYSTADGKATIGGPHRVTIVAYDGVPAKNEEGAEMPDGKELFSKPYETAVDLPKGDGEHDFAVPAQAPGP